MIKRMFGTADKPTILSETEQAKAKIEAIVLQVQKSSLCEDAAYLLNESQYGEPLGVKQVRQLAGEKSAGDLGLTKWLKVDTYVCLTFEEKKIELAAVNMRSWDGGRDENGSFYIWADGNLVFQSSCNRRCINEADVRAFFVTVSPDTLEALQMGNWAADISQLVLKWKQRRQTIKDEWTRQKEDELKKKAMRLVMSPVEATPQISSSPREPSAAWKWAFVLAASLIGSMILRYHENGHVKFSGIGFAAIVGGALPSFVGGMLFAVFFRGYRGIIVGGIVVFSLVVLSWIGTSPR